ncbi:hypothetical protein [Peribacillus frigoritolerans]|uniref:hypothetical protein n=1 Tax=Peribacillus frigoritolerans TaxID=450367 RepID=UPI0025A1D632|nr:hypothetical protein [Peribacillus frigoritolerans]MDM5310341.1 hypothetical protein [Peribacillus frigoritolerans]
MSKHSFYIGNMNINISIPDKDSGRRFNRKLGEVMSYRTVTFYSPCNPGGTRHDCYQEEILDDIKRDVKRVSKGVINGSQFYKHWMKLFFVKGNQYPLIQKDGVKVKRVMGEFLGHHTFRENTFYFLINGSKVEANQLKYESDDGVYYEL